jgi:hypothetical protein
MLRFATSKKTFVAEPSCAVRFLNLHSRELAPYLFNPLRD